MCFPTHTYGRYGNNDETESTAAQRNIARAARLRTFLVDLKETNSNSPYHPLFPHDITELVCSMLDNDSNNRPDIEHVKKRLTLLGGPKMIYHGDCCKNNFDSPVLTDEGARKFPSNSPKRTYSQMNERNSRASSYKLRVSNGVAFLSSMSSPPRPSPPQQTLDQFYPGSNGAYAYSAPDQGALLTQPMS